MEILLSLVIIFFTFYTMSEVVDKYFIKSLDNIAKTLGLSDDVAGATLMAFGTSAPEISTALFALFATTGGESIGTGTIVGSAIFQILVVIGFAASIATVKLDWKPVIRDSFAYTLALVLLIIFIADNEFTSLEAGILVGSYLFYLLFLFVWTKIFGSSPDVEIEPEVEPESAIKQTANPAMKVFNVVIYPVKTILNLIPDAQKNHKATLPVFIISLVLIGFCSYWMVFSAEILAEALEISPAIIALTILAGGTSIPEMISSAVVARQGRGDMAIANAVGSNIFDILVSLGLPVLLYTFINGESLKDVGQANIQSSVILLIATLLMVVVLLAAQKFKATRAFGVFLILVYCVYVVAAYSELL